MRSGPVGRPLTYWVPDRDENVIPPDSVPRLLGVLVAVLITAKTLGVVAQRLGQPAVVGELIAGVLLGGSVLRILDPMDPVIHALAQLGVLILLFEIGLHTDLRSLLKVGPAATIVACVGVIAPFVLGFAIVRSLGVETIPAIVAGAALTATSIGISARTLSDLGQLATREGQIVLGAAVIDDVIGLMILSVTSALVAGAVVSFSSITVTAAIAIFFILAAIIIGRLLAPPLFSMVERIEASGTLAVAGLAFAFLIAWLADLAGSATIIGAFAAGLVLHETPQRVAIERATTNVGHFFVPIFFAAVGGAVDVRALANPWTLGIAAVLIGAGIIGKIVSGFAPFWIAGRKLIIGLAMIPRGEVGLIFAQMGLASGALTASLFSAVAVMVLVTTLVTPPLLAAALRSTRSSADDRDQPGDGGIDDLVAGATARPSA
ncbi:MAG TPA: cation:proton antiporter [Gemmatimonadaceae bacterium]